MALSNQLIMNLLRIITPEEIGDITSKHNGGKFFSLTDLIKERVQKNIVRDFSAEITDDNSSQAKILPFSNSIEDLMKDEELSEGEEKLSEPNIDQEKLKQSLSEMALRLQNHQDKNKKVEHADDENMSSFILLEKERFKRSQKKLKEKEIIDLYSKTSNVDTEQLKASNENLNQSRESGILVNKKHY